MAGAGAIRDAAGTVVGRHEGVHRFTVGQRKGLGLSSPIPLYVVGIDADANSVTVGPRGRARADRAHGVGRQLDRRGSAGMRIARDRPDPPPPPRSGSDDRAARREPGHT